MRSGTASGRCGGRRQATCRAGRGVRAVGLLRWSSPVVEAFFSMITRQALRRGTFPTVADLMATIERFIDAWNDRCAPFT